MTIRPIYEKPGQKKKRSWIELTMFAFVAILLLVGGIALYSEYAPAIKSVPNRVADGFEQDRINILLIGVGGKAHPTGEGINLADAVMVLSLKPSTRQASLISVPRDFYVPVGNFGTHRLNAATSIGDEKKFPGGGAALLMETVGKIVGEPMHAFVRIDFAAFEKIIDQLGGVDIYVYRPFYDYTYKDGFNQGWQHMDGKRALLYARMRYIRASAEGNNFARELRQQQVIAALRDKVGKLSPQQALQLVNIARTVSEYTDTNLTTGQMVELYSMFRGLDRNQIRHVSLKPFTEVFNVTDPADPGEAVRPRTGNFNEIHTVADTVFTNTKPIVMRDEIQLTNVGPPPEHVPASVPATEAVAVSR